MRISIPQPASCRDETGFISFTNADSGTATAVSVTSIIGAVSLPRSGLGQRRYSSCGPVFRHLQLRPERYRCSGQEGLRVWHGDSRGKVGNFRHTLSRRSVASIVVDLMVCL